MDFSGAVDVDGGVVKESIDGSRILGLVKIRRLVHETLDSIGVCLPLPWSHFLEVPPDLDIVLCTLVVPSREWLVS